MFGQWCSRILHSQGPGLFSDFPALLLPRQNLHQKGQTMHRLRSARTPHKAVTTTEKMIVSALVGFLGGACFMLLLTYILVHLR